MVREEVVDGGREAGLGRAGVLGMRIRRWVHCARGRRRERRRGKSILGGLMRGEDGGG